MSLVSNITNSAADQTAPLAHVKRVLDELMAPPRIPAATYRVQLGSNMNFPAAQLLLPYLNTLGISDFYASPLFKPRTGSTHGYDTVDHNQFNPVLGTEEEFYQLSDALAEEAMGLLLDIVPNHMGVNTENVWWTDVLKNGPSSVYAPYFDINWRPPNRAMDDRVLLPVLGDHYGQVLEAGGLSVVYWHGDFYVHYYEHQFPLTPESYALILQRVLELLPTDLGEEDRWVPTELASVAYTLGFLPPYHVTDPEDVAARQREQTIVRWRLLGLFDKSELFRTALEQALDVINGQPGDPASFDMLDQLLSEQPYRLAYWRFSTDEINYRRFFDINDMAAIRVENPQVFDDMHRLTLRLMAEGRVSGLRIDHPDGLWNPTAYFLRLQAAYLETTLRQRLGDEPAVDYSALIEQRLHELSRQQHVDTPWPFYVLVEKILSASEPLPDTWAVYGTTGYDFMAAVTNLFVYAGHERAFNDLYTNFTGETTDFNNLTDRTKKLVMTQSLTSEIQARSAELAQIVEQNRRYRGFTQNSLAFGLSEFIAALEIYRTYITDSDNVSERDYKYIEEAMAQAKQRNPLMPSGLFDFLEDTLLMRNFDEFHPDSRADLHAFILKFQQITGPAMAKSVEDTAFYIYNRLVSLNEVGSHPDRFGTTLEEFHAHNTEHPYPHTMLSTSTHDTKRSEDVRARISVLSELPGEWRTRLYQWADLNSTAKAIIGDEPAPARNDEYLLYQTLIGAYEPDGDEELFLERIIAYMNKAINEAKVHSNWINPNDAYAGALRDFVTAIWRSPEFRASFDEFHARVAYFGYFNSLAQTLLKLTCPGVPDIYQGTELWDYSLVDPDNRRPVDFDRRFDLLRDLQAQEQEDRAALAGALLDDMDSGRIKLYLTYRTLTFRRRHEALFRAGDYLPLSAQGNSADHVVAFLRRHGGQAILVVVPRFSALLAKGRELPPMGEIWEETQLRLPADYVGHTVTNLFTDEVVELWPGDDGRPTLPLAAALAEWPIALFTIGRPAQ